MASGRVPVAEYERMRAPMQEGTFPFPVKYGYCAVGIVEDGPGALAGKTVFALHPHQDRFRAPASMLTPLPAQVPARRGILAANMETALNGLWDSAAGPADRIVVVGAGVIGLLVAYLCARLPGAEVTIVDIEFQPEFHSFSSERPLRLACRSTPARRTSCSTRAAIRPA